MGNHHDLQSFLCLFRTLKMEKPRFHEDVSRGACVYSVSYHNNMNNHQLAAFMSFSMCINLSFYQTGSFSHQNQWLKYKLLNLTHLSHLIIQLISTFTFSLETANIIIIFFTPRWKYWQVSPVLSPQMRSRRAGILETAFW